MTSSELPNYLESDLVCVFVRHKNAETVYSRLDILCIFT